jgi:hypothetical protein
MLPWSRFKEFVVDLIERTWRPPRPDDARFFYPSLCRRIVDRILGLGTERKATFDNRYGD